MKVTDFAAMIGHGAAMVRQVEAGTKKLPQKMALDIAKATGADLQFILGAGKRNAPFTLEGPSSRGLDDFSLKRTFVVYADLVAAYCLATTAGVNGQLLLHGIQLEVDRFVKRWKINPRDHEDAFYEIHDDVLEGAETSGYKSLTMELMIALGEAKPVKAATEANNRRTDSLLALEQRELHAGSSHGRAVEKHRTALDAAALSRLDPPGNGRRD